MNKSLYTFIGLLCLASNAWAVDPRLVGQLAATTREVSADRIMHTTGYDYWYRLLRGIEVGREDAQALIPFAQHNSNIAKFFDLTHKTKDDLELAYSVVREQLGVNVGDQRFGAKPSKVVVDVLANDLVKLRRNAELFPEQFTEELKALQERIVKVQDVHLQNAQLRYMREYALAVKQLETDLGKKLPDSLVKSATEIEEAAIKLEDTLTKTANDLNASRVKGWPRLTIHSWRRAESLDLDLLGHPEAKPGVGQMMLKHAAKNAARSKILRSPRLWPAAAGMAAVSAVVGASAANAEPSNTVGSPAASIDNYQDDNFGEAGTAGAR